MNQILSELSEQQLKSAPIFSINKNIYLAFPDLVSCMENSSTFIRLNYNCDQYQTNYDYFRQINVLFKPVEYVLEKNIMQWHFLQNQEKGLICGHTFTALVVLWNNPDFLELDENSKQILLWTMLFHDICKRGRCESLPRDPFHPFPCACKTLEIFVQYGLVERKSGIEEFFEFLMNRFVVENGTQLMDYGKIEEIFKGLLYFIGISDEVDKDFGSYSEVERVESEEKRFLFEILVLILFHQSLELNSIYPNARNISVEQVKRYLSKRMVVLSHIVHHADHNSYNVANYRMNEWPNDNTIKENAQKYLLIF